MNKKNTPFRAGVLLPLFFAVIVLVVLVVAYSCKKNESGAGQSRAGEGSEVTVWTYDSFVSEWGPAKLVQEAFAGETGLTVNFEAAGDGGELLSRALLEGKACPADIILGIDQNLLKKALESELFEKYKPKTAGSITGIIADEIGAMGDYVFIPFDYSYFAIIYDSQKVKNIPRSLEDLTKPEFAKSLILMDPRTSTPGLGFLAWAEAVYKSAWRDYIRRLRPNALTVAPGWDSGYGAFTKGEAPMVLSYTTSPGYHLEYEGSERYRAAIFPAGHPIQIEGALLLKTAPHKENAKRFLDFMLSDGFQGALPLTNWMYPVTNIELPESYSINVKPDITLWTEPPGEADKDEFALIFAED